MGDPSESRPKDEDAYDLIFCTSFFHKGLKRRVYAHEHGKKVFALKIRRKRV